MKCAHRGGQRRRRGTRGERRHLGRPGRGHVPAGSPRRFMHAAIGTLGLSWSKALVLMTAWPGSDRTSLTSSTILCLPREAALGVDLLDAELDAGQGRLVQPALQSAQAQLVLESSLPPDRRAPRVAVARPTASGDASQRPHRDTRRRGAQCTLLMPGPLIVDASITVLASLPSATRRARRVRLGDLRVWRTSVGSAPAAMSCPSLSTVMCSQSRIIIRTAWSATRMPAPYSSRMAARRSRNASASTSFMPAAGSSGRRKSGRTASARAISRRRLAPVGGRWRAPRLRRSSPAAPPGGGQGDRRRAQAGRRWRRRGRCRAPTSRRTGGSFWNVRPTPA